MTSPCKTGIRAGIVCATAFVLFAFLKNPFIPDVCSSTGYGYPLPVYISWCECFIEDSPWPINLLYVTFDILVWACIWKVLSAVLSGGSANQIP